VSTMAQISVSLATWKAIEANRLSLDEDHDAIIRRALVVRANRRKAAFGVAARAGYTPDTAASITRRRGDLSVCVAGRTSEVANLKMAYITILSQLVKKRPSLFQSLLREGSARRRWIALTPEALFPLSPHLVRQHAYKIAPGWFIDTNLSRQQIEARVAKAAELAGLHWGDSVQILGPTSL
jgi:hypothetical protein